MELLPIFLNLTPIVAITSFVLIFISVLNQKEKSNKLFSIGYWIGIGYIAFLIGIILPFEILNFTYKNYSTSILMAIVLLVFWLIISLILHFKNRIIILKNNEKEIYIRDIEVEYSPAVLSYLMNNKIETQKDLPATLLNLCANNVLEIEKDENGKLNIKDLKNKKQVEKLSVDEKYAYKMFITQVTKNKIAAWKNKIKEEYKKYNFSKSQTRNFVEYLLNLFMVLSIVIFIFAIVNIPGTDSFNEILAHIFIITFVAVLESFPFTAIKKILTKEEFIDTYTKKGAIEYNRWKKFEKFIEEYTFVKEKNFENIIVLGKYLSYSIALGINKKCDNELYKEINNRYSFDFNDISNIFKDEKTQEGEIK